MSSEVLQEDFKALFCLLLSSEGFERDSLTKNTAIPRISSYLWTTEKEKKQHLCGFIYSGEGTGEGKVHLFLIVHIVENLTHALCI